MDDAAQVLSHFKPIHTHAVTVEVSTKSCKQFKFTYVVSKLHRDKHIDAENNNRLAKVSATCGRLSSMFGA